MENTQQYGLNTDKASAFYNGLKDKGRVKQEGLNAFLENAKDPEYAKRFYNALSQKGYVKQDGIESFMNALYGSEPKGVPYADAPARSSMTDQFGVFDKAAEADAENQRKAAQHIEELQRAQKEAQKPRIMTPEEVNEMAAQPLLQDKGIDLFGQKEKQAQRTQDMLNAQQAPEKALSSINRNTEALDVLKARLEEVENDLKGENKAGTQYNEEMRSLLTENIKRLTEDTRKQQTDYFDQKLSELNDLYGAAHLKRGYNLLNSNDERRKHLQAIADNMDDEVAADIVKNRSLVSDAVRNLQRAKRKATLDNDASGLSKLFSGIATGFDGGAGLTLGLADISETFNALSAVNRINEGKGTKADYILANSLLDKMNADELYNPGIYGKIGEGAYESLKFTLEMLITGGIGGVVIKGVGAAGKAIAKKAGKEIAKKAAETAAKSATKQFAQRIGKDLAASAVGSTVSPMMYNEALRRQNENYLFGRDENGEVTVRETADPESLAESFAQALLSNNISRLVERGAGPVMEKGLQAIAKPLAKITPEWLKFGNNFLSNLGRNVKDLMSVQGFVPEYAEEFVEEILTRALVEQTSREKELGVGKWDDLFSPEWCLVTAGSVAVIQAAMGLPGFSASTANAAGNSARMRKHMRNLPDNLREEVGRIARMEDDNQRAQALSEVLKRSTDLQRRDILGYITARAANNLGLSFRRAAAQQQETEAYRQTLMTAATDGENLLVASDRDGNRFAYSPVSENDRWCIAYPIEGNAEDGTLQIGKPQQMDMSALDMGSTQEYTVSELLGSLAQRQETQDEAQDNAIEQQEQQAARPDADAQKVYVAGHEFNYTDPKGNLKTVARGSRIVPIETVQAGADPNTMVQVAITKPGGSTSMPGVMSLSEFQNMVERGYIAAEEQTEADTATDVQTDEEGNPVAEEDTLPQEEAAVAEEAEPAAPETVEKNGLIGRSATEEEAEGIISQMEANAEEAPEVELTPENWTEQFGEKGETNTPIGTVKMGENQLAKMFLRKRDKEFGMIFPTLTDPDLIIEEESSAKDGSEERPSSYLFVKTFLRDGKKVKHYASVTVQKEGMEVVVSNHYLEESALKGKLQNGKVLYTKEALLSNSSDGHLAEHQNGVPDLLPTQENNASSENKGTEVSEEKQVRLPENPVQTKYESLLAKIGDEENVKKLANEMVANMQAELNQAQKNKPKGKNEEEILSSILANKEKVAALETEVKFWKDVAAYPEAKRQAEEAARKLQKRIDAQQREANSKRTVPRFMAADPIKEYPKSLEEYLYRWIASGAITFKAETKKYEGGGKTSGIKAHNGRGAYLNKYTEEGSGRPGDYVENIADYIRINLEADGNPFGVLTNDEIISAIDNIGVGHQTPKEMMAEAVKLHNKESEEEQRYNEEVREAYEEAERKERAREEAAADIAQASVEYMSDEEYEALSRPEFVGEMFNTDGTPKRVAPASESGVMSFEEAGEKLDDIEAEWNERIMDYIYEHYPTQATVSAATNSEQGLREREAMKKDERLKQLRAEMKAAVDKADAAAHEAYLREKAEGDEEVRMRRGEPRQDNDLSEEERGIVERAKADGTYLKAPNGKPTQLSPKQWAQVRTKAFKDWFGDWELPTKAVEIVNKDPKKGDIITEHGFKNFDEAREWAKKNITGIVKQREIGDINISGTSIEKYLSKKAVKKSENEDVHLVALRKLPSIIENSIVGEIHADKKGDTNIKDVVRLFGCLQLNGKLYRVKTTVKRYSDRKNIDKAYSYEITKIELLEGTGAPHTQSADFAPTSNNSISVAKLLQGVKKSNSNEEILNASKVVDENGEPLVVYHGARRSGFSIFDDTEGEKKSEAPEGTSWFSSNPDVARSYSGTYDKASYELDEEEEYGEPGNYACFLNIRNPYYEDFNGANWDGSTYGKYQIEANDEDGAFDYVVDKEDGTRFFDSIDEAENYAKENGIENYEIREDPWLGTTTNNVASDAKEWGYDGAIITNVIDTGGLADPGEATVYVAFSPNQIKSATDNVGAFDAKNPDIRFRRGEPVEEKGNLVAVHNLSEDKIRQAFELGGFPMPSIAVTKADIGHTEFGDISLVFNKESINPTDRRNKVYGEDAWTPTFPQIGYKLNEEKTDDIYTRANKVGELPLFRPVSFYQDNYERLIDRTGSESLISCGSSVRIAPESQTQRKSRMFSFANPH